MIHPRTQGCFLNIVRHDSASLQWEQRVCFCDKNVEVDCRIIRMIKKKLAKLINIKGNTHNIHVAIKCFHQILSSNVCSENLNHRPILLVRFLRGLFQRPADLFNRKTGFSESGNLLSLAHKMPLLGGYNTDSAINSFSSI